MYKATETFIYVIQHIVLYDTDVGTDNKDGDGK